MSPEIGYLIAGKEFETSNGGLDINDCLEPYDLIADNVELGLVFANVRRKSDLPGTKRYEIIPSEGDEVGFECDGDDNYFIGKVISKEGAAPGKPSPQDIEKVLSEVMQDMHDAGLLVFSTTFG